MSTIHQQPLNPAQSQALKPATLDHLALLTIREVAQLTGVPIRTVCGWIRSGQLRSTRHPDSWGPAEEIAALFPRAIRVCVNDLDIHIEDNLNWGGTTEEGTGVLVIDTPAGEYLSERWWYWKRRRRLRLKFKPAQWIEDPTARHELRYWDGKVWTWRCRVLSDTVDGEAGRLQRR
jgi:Protein of unknown function (DUF2510)